MKNNSVLEGIAQFQNRIPFRFRMPENKHEFKEKRLPGNYKELEEKYKPGDIVMELDEFEVKHVCVLKGVTEDRHYMLTPADSLKNNKEQEDISVWKFRNLLEKEERC